MSSHADNYGLIPPFKTVALIGANGQIGSRILSALLSTKHHIFDILAFIPPDTHLPEDQIPQDHPNVTIKQVDLTSVLREELAEHLQGVDAVVVALNGEALKAQPKIQDAAADAKAKRFYPSEFGMHNIYRKSGDPWGYIHPAWNLKAEMNELAILHPAVRSGAMSYTMIGCGDFYNQDREKVWCPWTQSPESVGAHYTIHVIGDPDAEADYTHLDDFASFLVATLLEPAKSENRNLNVVSDTISHRKIAELLERYSGQKVVLDVKGLEEMEKVIEDPGSAPKELGESAFPVEFWHLVKGCQGMGRFVRPKSQIHNGEFEGVKWTTFEGYFKQRFGSNGRSKL